MTFSASAGRRQAVLTDEPGVAAAERRGLRQRVSRFALDTHAASPQSCLQATLVRSRHLVHRHGDRRGGARLPDVPADRVDTRRRSHLAHAPCPVTDADRDRRGIRRCVRPPSRDARAAVGNGRGQPRARGERRPQPSTRLAVVRLPVRHLRCLQHRSGCTAVDDAPTRRRVALHGSLGAEQRHIPIRCSRRSGAGRASDQVRRPEMDLPRRLPLLCGRAHRRRAPATARREGGRRPSELEFDRCRLPIRAAASR